MDHPVLMCVCAAIVLAALTLLTAIPTIDRWERAQGYPYGKLCDVFLNCRSDR